MRSIDNCYRKCFRRRKKTFLSFHTITMATSIESDSLPREREMVTLMWLDVDSIAMCLAKSLHSIFRWTFFFFFAFLHVDEKRQNDFLLLRPHQCFGQKLCAILFFSCSLFSPCQPNTCALLIFDCFF